MKKRLYGINPDINDINIYSDIAGGDGAATGKIVSNTLIHSGKPTLEALEIGELAEVSSAGFL